MSELKFASKRVLLKDAPPYGTCNQAQPFDTVIFTTRPPFPWEMLMRISANMESALVQRERIILNSKDSCEQIPYMRSDLPLGEIDTQFQKTNITNFSSENLKENSTEDLITCLVNFSTQSEHISTEACRSLVSKHAKNFRKKQIYSFMKNGNADISYYSANHIEEQLVELIKKAREHRSNLRIVVAAAMFGHFLSIHPFQDGNGRAARFLLQACLRKQGLWNDLDLPLGHLAKLDRKNYIQSLRGLTINGNYQKFMEYTSMWIAAAAELAFLKKSSERQ